VSEDRAGETRRRQCLSRDEHHRPALTQGHQGGKIQDIDVPVGGTAVSGDAVFRFIEPSPKVVVTGQEKSVDPRVARGLDDLLGFGCRLARREQCVEPVDRRGARLGQLWLDERIGAPMQLGFAQSIRIFRNAVGLDLPPSGDLPEMPFGPRAAPRR